MDTDDNRKLSLGLSARPAFLPIVTQFVETAASVFGLGKEEYIKLGLATEEIFMYLSTFVCHGKPLEVQCLNGLYYTRVFFRFSASELNLGGLNITSTMSYDRESDLQEMGLMIASHSVDHLSIIVEKHNRICLAVTKEKYYPKSPVTISLPKTAEKTVVETPGGEQIKLFATLVGQYYKEPQRPTFFNYPGKVLDMIASGEYQSIVAVNQKKEITGGILFQFRTDKIVQCFGPYIFYQGKEDIVEILLSACIGRIARTKALGLLSLSGLPESLQRNFEALGSLTYYAEDGATIKQTSFYRHLHEDPGCEVWSHADLTPYLQKEYHRLILARDIRPIHDMGETRSGSSLFASEVHRERAEVILRPLLPGVDFSDNVKRHVRFLRDDGFLNLFFELDLGMPWHAELIPVLMANQFKPEILLPFAGQSDLIIFQYHDATKP